MVGRKGRGRGRGNKGMRRWDDGSTRDGYNGVYVKNRYGAGWRKWKSVSRAE